MGTRYEITIEVDGATSVHAFEGLEPDHSGCGADKLKGIVEAGCKAFAGTRIDYDAFKSDSAYLDAIDADVATYAIVALDKAGERKRWHMDAVYPEDGGLFSDAFEAVDAEDAAFQARWACALNIQSATSTSLADFDDFTEAMDSMENVSGWPEPVSLDEALAMVASLLDQPGAAAIAAGRAMLAAAGRPVPGLAPEPGPASEHHTFAMIKSDAVARGDAREILKIATEAGFEIVRLAMRLMTVPEAHAFYAEHEGRPYHAGLIRSVTSNPVVMIHFKRPDAVAAWRRLIGATDPSKAAPGTIRATYGRGLPDNAVHGSDGAASCARELAIAFGHDHAATASNDRRFAHGGATYGYAEDVDGTVSVFKAGDGRHFARLVAAPTPSAAKEAFGNYELGRADGRLEGEAGLRAKARDLLGL